MAGVSIDDFGASFIHYRKGVIDTLNHYSNARKIPTGKLKWEGSELQKHVHVELNPAIAAVGDGGALPAAKKQTYAVANAKRKFIVGSVQVTDGILNNAKTTKHAAVRVVDSELKGMMKGIHKFENFFFTRDGTGVVGDLGSDADPVTDGVITVSDARGLWDTGTYQVHDATSTASTPVKHYSFEVDKVARALTGGEATVTTTNYGLVGTAAQNDFIVWKGNSSSDSFGLLPMGLSGMINDGTSGTFQNINMGTYPRYTSPVLDASSSTLTPSLLRRMMAMINQESMTKVNRKSYTVLSSVWDMVNFSELYESELRITPGTSTVGVDAPSFVSPFGEFTLVTDGDSPYGTMFFIDRKQITRAVQKELDWRKSDGGGILTKSSNSLVYTADCVEICEFFIDDRRSCGKIENLAVTIDTAY
jgi:hypothetical protein